MNEYNAWENTNLFKSITIEELLKKIRNGETNLIVGRKYIPGNETHNFFETICSDKKQIINYTNHNYPIIWSKSNEIHINAEYFKKYENEIKKAFIESYNNPNLDFFFVPNFIFSQELLNRLLTKKNVSLHFKGVKLTNEQIKQIKNHFINATMDSKRISSKYIIGFISYDEIQTQSEFYISQEELINCDYYNFLYFKDNSIIKTHNISLTDNNKNLKEDKYLKVIFELLKKIDTLDKKIIFNIEVNKRSVLEKYLRDNKFRNVQLRINNDGYEYSYEEYVNEENKLYSLIEPIKNSNMTPFEKYIAVYNIVKNFKPYKENENDAEQARYLRNILYNDYIVCVGYSTLLETLLDKVGINANSISVSVDTSYDNGFDPNNPEEISVNMAGHRRVIVNLDDDKYQIHGLYMADPTWDNNLDKNYLNYSVMTFDNMINNKRMFAFDTYEPILCFHTFKDYMEQVNYLIQKEIKYQSTYQSNHNNKDKILNKSFERVANNLLNSIRCDKRIKYFTDTLMKCNNQEEYEDLFTKLGRYLLLRINNPVDKEKILYANDVVKKTIDHMESGITKEEYEARDILLFPYEVPVENDHNLIPKK